MRSVIIASARQRMAQVVEMRYIGCYSDREIAEALAATIDAACRVWGSKRVWMNEGAKCIGTIAEFARAGRIATSTGGP